LDHPGADALAERRDDEITGAIQGRRAIPGR
jgi:hypothetical protein